VLVLKVLLRQVILLLMRHLSLHRCCKFLLFLNLVIRFLYTSLIELVGLDLLFNEGSWSRIYFPLLLVSLLIRMLSL
jgi:hypothetical protein